MPITCAETLPGWIGIRPFVLSAVLILPAAILVAPHLGETSYILLTVFGIYCFLRSGLSFRKNSNLLLFSLLTLGFYSVALVSALVSDDHSTEWWNPGNLREFLAAPFIGLLIAKTRINTRFLMLTVKLSAIVVFLVAFYQVLNGTVRPGGAVNPLVFAIIALLLGFFSIIRLPLESPAGKLLSLISFTAGSMACVISQSRGAWILSIFLFAYVLFAWYRTGHLTKRMTLGITTLILTLVLISAQTSMVMQRTDSALASFHSFQVDGKWQNSIGKRIIMWKSGLSAALKKPLSGWGTDQTQVAAAAQVESPEMKRVILGYNHLHNEYITTLVAKGLPGLTSLLLVLFAPIFIFFKQSRHSEQLAYHGIGSLLCIGYALSGLSNLAFGDDTLNIFFIFFLAITLTGCEFIDGDNKSKREASTPAGLI